MDSFYDNGWLYSRQWRTCGKATCRCAAGELHGPYWYKREVAGGKAIYLGREIDPNLLAVMEQRRAYQATIEAHIVQLAADQRLLQDLIEGQPLNLNERHRLEQLGYGHLI